MTNNTDAIIRYQYDNHLGSASLELDANGAIISYEEHHPFGTTSYRSGRTETETSQKRYKYVGKERDEETGLYYYGFRYYAAWLCRFVSVDPLQFEYPQLTPYNYAGNKPVTHFDIDGLQGTGDEKRVKNDKPISISLTKPKAIASSTRRPLYDPNNPTALRDDLVFGDRTNEEINQEGERYWINMYEVDASATDARLFQRFHEMSRDLFTSWGMTPVLREMIDFFESNDGGSLGRELSPDGQGYAIYTNERLNQEAENSEEGIAFLDLIQNQIIDQINNEINPNDIYLAELGDDERIRWNDFWTHTFRGGLTVAINDTQAFDVTLDELNVNEEGIYTGRFTAIIFDHFGLDDTDVTPGLFPIAGFRAWYRLQRERGYRPFVTQINLTREFSGTLNK